MHFAQASTRFPEPKRAHCKLGYLLTFWVGLYFPRSFTKVQPMDDFLPHTAQILEAMLVFSLRFTLLDQISYPVKFNGVNFKLTTNIISYLLFFCNMYYNDNCERVKET